MTIDSAVAPAPLALSSFLTRALNASVDTRRFSSSSGDLALSSRSSIKAALAMAGSNPPVLTRPPPTPTRLCVDRLATKSSKPTGVPSGKAAPRDGGDMTSSSPADAGDFSDDDDFSALTLTLAGG